MLSKIIKDVVVRVKDVGKCYHIYDKPHQRLIQSFLGSKKKLYKDFWALRDISFEVQKGETVGIIGLNGSGKSTLLQLICGTLSPTQGDVQITGRLAALLELGAGFNPQFTGRENVYMNGALMGMNQRQMDQRIRDIEGFAEIGEFIDQPVKTYSSGMFVRLAFASAVNVDPDILVIDEALAVGDMVFQHRCMSKIRDLRKEKSIIFVSHDISTVISICDKVIWLDAGKIQEIGNPKSVSEHYHAYAYELSQRYVKNTYSTRNGNRDLGRFGDHRAKIVEMKILDSEGKGMFDLWPDHSVNIQILTECIENVEKPLIGFTVRDRVGNIIFSTDSSLEDLIIPKMTSGKKILVSFAFSWPNVSPGSYSFSPHVKDGSSDGQTICDWIYDAIVLRANNGKGVPGLIGLRNVKVELSESKRGSSV